MYVEQILALMRVAKASDPVVANLAEVILGLIEQLQAAETRADLAEATLEANEAELAQLRAMVRRENA